METGLNMLRSFGGLVEHVRVNWVDGIFKIVGKWRWTIIIIIKIKIMWLFLGLFPRVAGCRREVEWEMCKGTAEEDRSSTGWPLGESTEWLCALLNAAEYSVGHQLHWRH